MALNVPTKNTIELETANLDAELLESIKNYNDRLNSLIIEFGQIHMRKKEIQEELVRMDDFLEKGEDEFKMVNNKLRETIDGLDDQYPQGRINMQDGTITYQPGAPTRKQLAEQQRQAAEQGNSTGGLKVVKE
jgi:hypothetical protein